MLYADHLGTLRAVLNASGTGTYAWPWVNNAFGEQAPTGTASFYNRFPGQNFDEESGLSYNHHRFFDPITGGYGQSDPMGLFGGQNSTYAYANSNPLNNTDALGLFLWPWEAPEMINGGTADEQAQVQSAVDQVFSTPEGQQMLAEIDGPWYEHGDPQTLNIDDYGTDEAVPNSGVLDVNPNATLWIQTPNGTAQASLARIIAHELGHSLRGTLDDGPCRMNNVNKNENPVAKALGQPLRIKY